MVLVDNRGHVFGADFYKKINVPVFVIAPDTTSGFDMLNKGADEMMVLSQPSFEHNQFTYMMLARRFKIFLQTYSANENREAKYANERIRGRIIAIGASTGGTEVILGLLKRMPADAPPILVVQHMPPVFTKLYAERVNAQCAIDVWEAKDGDVPVNGLALVAPGDFHMELVKKNDAYAIRLNKNELVKCQRPAVDVLFDSVAEAAGGNAVGVILTGMGDDGACGLKKMRDKGAHTIGQDEETCTVYGMPRAAYEMGAVCVQLPIHDIADEIKNSMYKLHNEEEMNG
jgi:two-component system chemotaxis response regulator CheB